MRIHCRGIGIGSWAAALVAVAGAVDAAMFSLKAVRINPECVGGANAGEFCTKDDECDSLVCSGAITPTNKITVFPSDIIVCEIYASEWSPDDQRLRAFQFTLDGSAIGTEEVPVLPAYWDNPNPEQICQYDTDCNPPQVCWIPEESVHGGYCAGPDQDPERGAFIDSTRDDYIFNMGIQPVPWGEDVNLSTLNFRYSSTFTGSVSIMPVYTPPPKYCGTLTLEVLPDACGTFTVTGFPFPESLFLDSTNLVIPLEVVHGLEIDAGCCPPEFEPDPPNCAIDARQPCDPDGTNPAGWDSITFTFEYGDPCDFTREDFTVREEPFGDPPLITSVTCDVDSLTIQLSRRISLQTWTCIKYVHTGEEFCIAHLPGDVSGDRTAAPMDILRLIDCLNSAASCEMWQCDADRSGQCGPLDILRVIDLLNGAGAYEPWLNRTLPECPSAPDR